MDKILFELKENWNIMSEVIKKMDHNEYPERLKTKTVLELLYIMRDASEAAAVNPEGPNVGYYLDEVNYAAMELARRRQSK